MALSGKTLSEMIPTRENAIDGRRVMDWDKDSAHDAGFALNPATCLILRIK